MLDFTVDTQKTVLVTGATGYVAGWIIKKLLDAGVNVHGTVRDPGNTAKVGHLNVMAESTPGSLKLFQADLLDEGSFDGATAGCSVVFHTASPYTINVEDPQRDLVDPAEKGTRNVLGSVNGTDSVMRVVLTSSVAAIYGDIADSAAAPGGTLTEDVWNTSSSLEHMPYSYSKTLAERTAWEIVGAQSRWKLVVVNPAGIYGPWVGGPMTKSESFNIIRQIGDGTMKSGVPNLEFGKVDVQDVVEAHLRAAYIPEAEGRHILAEKPGTFLDMANAISAAYPDYPLPKREMPKWLIWLVGPLINKALSRRFVSCNVGHNWRADNSKSCAKLGLSYSSTDDAIVEMFGQMIEAGAVRR